MKIWIDADSCPKQVRDHICKRALILKIPVEFVANRIIPFQPSPLFSMHVQDATQDAADDFITENASISDLVITRDIPFAKRLVDKGLRVLNDRGIVYTEQNINERLATRNLMQELYSIGIYPEKTSNFGKKELQEFSNALDRELTRSLKKISGK
jgi:uncharacterized protein YaiI (UPF0178 family)